MAKPALGRGLGNLLGDTQIADKPEPARSQPDAAQPAVSPGLGNLLAAGRNGGGDKVAESAAAPPSEPVPTEAEHPRRSVPQAGRSARFSQGSAIPAVARAELPEEAPVQAPRWVLWGADLLLVSLAGVLVFRSPAPLKPWEMTLCVAAVMLGAVLACVAALSKPRR